jgi:hypothetical protein
MKRRALLVGLLFAAAPLISSIISAEGSGRDAVPGIPPTPKPTAMPAELSILYQNRPEYPRLGEPSSPVRGVVGDWWADLIIGQPDFSQITPNEVVGNKLFNPGGVYVDRSTIPNRVYVYDAGNSRVLGFSSMGTCAGGNNQGQACTSESDCPGSSCEIREDRTADVVLGQPSPNSSACNGDSAYQDYPEIPLPSEQTLCGMRAISVSILEAGSSATMATDSQGNLYLTDLYNNRVLRYDDPLATDGIADYVWGQSDFSGAECNQGADYGNPDDMSLCLAPVPGSGAIKAGVAVDEEGHLWVADNQNNRVLRFPFDSGLGRPSQKADLVLGQPDFESAGSGSGVDQMNSPASVRVDGEGIVYVADGVDGTAAHSRVLEFLPPLSNGMPGIVLIQSGLGETTGLELDAGDGLWVNDCDKGRLLRFVDGELQRTVNGISNGVYGGMGIDRDDNIMLTGWCPQEVLVYTAPDYAWTSTFVRADEFGSFNRLGPRGVTDPTGLEVAAGQLIVADNSRILYWNFPWNLANGEVADGVVGQPDFYTRPRWSPAFGRMRADNQSRLWVVKGNPNTKILAYQLPLSSGAEPIIEIVSPVPLQGGGTFAWSGSLQMAGLAIQPDCDCLWLSDSDHSRTFRINHVSTEQRAVDIVLGQLNVEGIHCNQGRDSDDGYEHPTSPSRDSLCHPGGLAFDGYGNLYVADHNLEVAGNWRLLEFDADTLPDSPSSAVFGIPASRVWGRNGSFTEPDCQWPDPMCGPWEPALNSDGLMVVGFNGYLGPRFPQVYADPLNDPLPSGEVNDFHSHAYSARFDQYDNLYILDHSRNRVLIYWHRLVTTYPVYLPLVTNDRNAASKPGL